MVNERLLNEAYSQVDKERIEDPDNHLPMSGAPCPHDILRNKGQEYCWCKYPQSKFPNWTEKQQRRSGIRQKIKNKVARCRVYYVDVSDIGRFTSVGTPKRVDNGNGPSLDEQWNLMMNEVSRKCLLLQADRIENVRSVLKVRRQESSSSTN